MLDWIFEGIVKWVAGVASELLDTVSGLFLNALGTDMTAMEEYFPFVTKAFTVMQYCSWAVLFLITVWQLFRVFGGPITEAENPLTLIARSSLFAVLIAYAKPIFLITLDIARAPYTALLDITMTGEDFTFAGVEQTLSNGIASFVAITSVVGTLLILILLIALGWNYFKLLLLTMNVWFLRGFSTSVGQFIGNGGALSNGNGSIFLWLFCALAFLKTAQRFDSYLASLGLNVAQTGSSMGMEMLMAARVLSGAASSSKTAGKTFFNGGSSAASTAASSAGTGFATGFASKFKGNSYVRDAVVAGGTPMGAGGGMGVVGRAFGGIAARNGATLTGESISSVASRQPSVSGSIGGEIADRSLSNYIPQMSGYQLQGTSISGGQISTTAMGNDGKSAEVAMFSAAQYETPSGPHSVVTASDGSQWYQMAAGAGAGAFFDAPTFSGNTGEAGQMAQVFPGAEDGTLLRTVGDGVMEASTPEGNSLWYNSAYYDEPDAPHSIVQSANGVDWYAMQQNAQAPEFETGEPALAYNQAQFQAFMPGFEQKVANVDGSTRQDGHFEVRHENGSGTMFFDTTRYAAPRGDYKVYEDVKGGQWYAIPGEAVVERRLVYENGKPVYDDDMLRTTQVATVRYKNQPSRYAEPQARALTEIKTPRRKR